MADGLLRPLVRRRDLGPKALDASAAVRWRSRDGQGTGLALDGSNCLMELRIEIDAPEYVRKLAPHVRHEARGDGRRTTGCGGKGSGALSWHCYLGPAERVIPHPRPKVRFQHLVGELEQPLEEPPKDIGNTRKHLGAPGSTCEHLGALAGVLLHCAF